MSFFRYPGGKSKLRNKITRRLIERLSGGMEYREPFFGGGSIGLQILANNPGIKKIWINDRDIGIACLWTAVIRHPTKLKDRVSCFVPSVDAFFQMKDELIAADAASTKSGDIVDIGFKKLAIHQISYSGLGTKSGGPLGGLKQESEYRIDCRWSPSYICKKIDHLHRLFQTVEVRGEECTSLDFVDLVKDTSDSLLYLDPPYYGKGANLYQRSFTDWDHRRLAYALESTNHVWVLSYDDCSGVRDLYKWAYAESLNVGYSITALKDKESGGRMSRTKGELLIYPELTEGAVDVASACIV